MLTKFLQREKRFIKSEKITFFVLPLILLPLLFELLLHGQYTIWFDSYHDEVLIANIVFIVLARFAVLDTAVYIFSRSKNHIHLALVQIVLLYRMKYRTNFNTQLNGVNHHTFILTYQ